MFKKTKSIISLLLSVMIVFGLVPLGAPAITYAAQDNEYVDPADVWMQANGRTNEFDINASITYETMPCTVCNMDTSFQVFRVPEYTKSGDTAYNRGVKYSDGTLESGSGTANLDEGIPGKNATYTGYHWNKSVCQNCGTINASSAIETYGHGKNVYMLSPCDNNFFLDFDSTTYEKYDEDCHTTTLKRGEYCQFCKGTYARAIEREDEHEFTEQIDPQIGNSRFFIKEICEDCGYETSEYVTAKSVVASYYGVVDGQAHSVEITDISDRGVRTTVRYGETADDVRLSSPPAYTDAGYYSVYYNTTYSYGGESMEENGVAYVWLLPNDEAETQDAPGKPGDPDNPGDGTGAPGGPGSPSGSPGSGGIPHEHDYHYLETVPPTCGELGFERFQCKVCGALQKTNYTEATGHDYGSTEVREASCNQSGLTLYICKNCGDFYSETTPMTGHLYQTNNVLPTCKSVGYTEHTCLTCGQSYTDNILPIAAHNYDRITKAATCTEMGYTSYVCSVCGDTKVMDYEPAKGHDWDAGREVTNSTCVSAGVKHSGAELRAPCGAYFSVVGVKEPLGIRQYSEEPFPCLRKNILPHGPKEFKASKIFLRQGKKRRKANAFRAFLTQHGGNFAALNRRGVRLHCA